MKVTPYDPADYLDSEEVIEAYLKIARDDPDPQVFVDAQVHVDRARKMYGL